MDLLTRHEGHEHEEEHEEEHGHGHGHGHGSEDSMRQHALASLYWYTLATVLILAFVGRLISAFIARQRIKRRDSNSDAFSSVSAVERLLDGPRAVVSVSFLSRHRPTWLAALPLKKASLVAIYAAFVAFLVTFKSIKHDETFYERIGFRAAWITVTQTSFPFLLAARYNPIGLILGTSCERINWFHRWASRVFIATATVHGGFFVTEWLTADFFWEELRTVRMVIPGLAAWFMLIWTLASSLFPIRRWNYEFFVFQHIFSVVLLLVFLFLHVPDHHQFSVWCAAAAYAYDVVTRCANPIWRNIRLRLPTGGFGRVSRIAHKANATAIDDDLTVITIPNVGFTWSPGQHVLIWLPEFWKQSPHPFTICSTPNPELKSQDVHLTLKTKGGLTRKLNNWARRAENTGGDGSFRLLLAGPYGALPNWRQFDSLVLIAASTGGSFTTPILEDLITSQSPSCVRRISALYIVRRKAHVEPYLQRISHVISRAKEMGISVRIEIAITQCSRDAAGLGESSANESRERLIESEPRVGERRESVELERFSIESPRSSTSERSDALLKEEMDLALNDGYDYDASFMTESVGRPDVAAFTRNAVGNVPGNVAVAICGGRTIERVVEMTVASLRRDRVSEGLSAQDLALHLERSES
ncbi:Fc.00g044470.m01.CDS01 [Cosmosporella sp. VM-42]